MFFLNRRPPHLLQSMSLISGKTFPWSCFSLTSGSNVRLLRISFFSWGVKESDFIDVLSFKWSHVWWMISQALTFGETLGCSSGRSAASANQSKHLEKKFQPAYKLWYIMCFATMQGRRKRSNKTPPDSGKDLNYSETGRKDDINHQI